VKLTARSPELLDDDPAAARQPNAAGEPVAVGAAEEAGGLRF